MKGYYPNANQTAEGQVYPYPNSPPQAIPQPGQPVYYGPPQVPIAIPPGIPMQMPLVAGMPYPESPMEALQRLNEAWICQKLQWNSIVVCREHRFYVYGAFERKNGQLKPNPNDKLFRFQEHSTCDCRTCCKTNMREFTMTVEFKRLVYNTSTGKLESKWQPFLHIDRKFQCTCCSLNRPFMEVSLVNGALLEKIGQIDNPFKCCEGIFLLSQRSQLGAKFKVMGDLCQCGMCCHCPCEACKEVKFFICDPMKSDEHVGSIVKVLYQQLFYIDMGWMWKRTLAP